MRDFHLAVPCDCVASNTEEENRAALEQIRSVLKADTRPSTELSFDALGHKAPEGRRPPGKSEG